VWCTSMHANERQAQGIVWKLALASKMMFGLELYGPITFVRSFHFVRLFCLETREVAVAIALNS
jgi:hypothetical protein